MPDDNKTYNGNLHASFELFRSNVELFKTDVLTQLAELREHVRELSTAAPAPETSPDSAGG
jgi:hypothetical protein